MTIGLILLGIIAILIFFGLTESFFRKIGIANWLAFLLVIALVIGGIIPRIQIGFFSINIGGFIIPLAIMVVFLAVMREPNEAIKSLIATLAVAASAVATRMLIQPINAGLILSASLIIGFVGGAVAFLTAQTRAGALSAVLGGILLGDVIVNLIDVLAFNSPSFSLGNYGVFDSLIIGATFAMVLTEAINAIKRLSTQKSIARRAFNTEASQDTVSPYPNKNPNYKSGNNSNNNEKNCIKDDCNPEYDTTNPEYDGFFDEFI